MASGNHRAAMAPGIPRRRVASLLVATSVALAMAACGGSDNGGGSSSNNPDDGSQLTMWVRSATDQFSQRLVDAYNASHKNHISLTIIPNDNYLTKVGAAAGSRSLPDILASDVVYTPNYTK
jgi:multiple sugar transport system substrate-binding protein